MAAVRAFLRQVWADDTIRTLAIVTATAWLLGIGSVLWSELRQDKVTVTSTGQAFKCEPVKP